jgi:hypothetical protein
MILVSWIFSNNYKIIQYLMINSKLTKFEYSNKNTYRLIPQFSLASILSFFDIFSSSRLSPTFSHFNSKRSISNLLFFHKSEFSSFLKILINVRFTLACLRVVFVTAIKIIFFILLITLRFINVWKIFLFLFVYFIFFIFIFTFLNHFLVLKIFIRLFFLFLNNLI